MTRRNTTSWSCTNGDVLVYDTENKLTSITVGGATSILKYYYFGKQRIALRNSVGVVYLHSDHLGSTSATSGATSSSQTYYPFGSIRTTTGSVPTDFGFTGQRRDASSNLMYYGARYYDTTLGRFISADTMVPQPKNPQDLNRYAYVNNNPLKYVDPSGHAQVCADGDIGGGCGGQSPQLAIQADGDLRFLQAYYEAGAMRQEYMRSRYVSEALCEVCAEASAAALENQLRYAENSIPAYLWSDENSSNVQGERFGSVLMGVSAGAPAIETILRAGVGAVGAIGAKGQSGIGLYKDTGGHHIHQKAAFLDNPNYDPNKAVSISQKMMNDNGWNHGNMTTRQRQLFDELAVSGRPNIMTEHDRIAVEALKAGGVDSQTARYLTGVSSQNLLEQGIFEPSGIPWHRH